MRRRRPVHLLEVGVRWPPETFIGWKLEGLAARGMRVSVASRGVFDPTARLRGVELLEIPRRGMPRRVAWRIAVRAGLALLLRSPRRLLTLARGVRRVPVEVLPHYRGRLGVLAFCLPLAPLRPDVVHFEWHSSAVDYAPLFDVWKCPIATSARGSDLYVHPYAPGMEHYSSRLADTLARVDAVHCVCEALKEEAIGLGLGPGKARVIRSSVDPDLFRPASRDGRPTDVMRAVSVGWLRWEKGHEYALEAVRMARDRGVPVELEMLGGLPAEWLRRPVERDRILHTIADLDLAPHVRLAGEVSSAEIGRRLAQSDVLLHAAVTEGLPNAVIEAMACGLPVVASRCGGVAEAVGDGVEGFVVPPRDPTALADALERLWRDPALRARMGAAGRTRAAAEHTVEQEHDDFLAMYRELVGR